MLILAAATNAGRAVGEAVDANDTYPMSSPFEAARWWLGRGFVPVPIAAGSKAPPKGFRLRRVLNGHQPSSEEIKSWWERWPGAHVGLVMGRGLVAVDSDTAEAEEAIRAMSLPRTPMQRTFRGYHRFFAVDGPTRSRKGRIPGLDLRAADTFVVIAPSRHPDGAEYSWEVPPTELFAPLPREVLDLFSGGTPCAAKGPLPSHLQEALRQHSRLRGVFEGKIAPSDTSGSGRDLLLMHIACKAGLTAADAVELMFHARYPKRTPRDEDYIRRTLALVYKSGTGGNARPRRSAYGRVPAEPVNSGFLGSLGANAAWLYTVLRVRMMPSRDPDAVGVDGVVRDGRDVLEAKSKLSGDQIKRALSKLKRAGFVRLQRWRCGTIIWVLAPPDLQRTGAPQVTREETGEVRGEPPADPAPPREHRCAVGGDSRAAPADDPSGKAGGRAEEHTPPTIHDHEAPGAHWCTEARFHLGRTGAPKGGGDSDEDPEPSEACPGGVTFNPWED